MFLSILRAVLLAVCVGGGSSNLSAAEYVPREALQYKRELIGNAHAFWGLDAPIAVLASQIHQESRWRPNAKSAYAVGLAQFTPDTANWISGVYPKELGENQPYNPSWALRALVKYDYRLYTKLQGDTVCDKMAFVLASYNGGTGWVIKDKNLAKTRGDNPYLWFGHVEVHNSGRAKHFFEENRTYPKRILKVLQPLYINWGPTITCA